MARQTRTIGIDGESYDITQLGAVRGMELYHALVTELAPVIQEDLKKGIDTDVAELFGGIVLKAISKISPGLMRELRIEFAAHTKIHAGGITLKMSDGDIFDQHFAGQYGRLTKWMLEHLKYNFLGFLADSKPGVSPLPAAPPQ